MKELKRVVLTHGIEVAYDDSGIKNKPTLLFIHGLANYYGVWNWNIDTLKAHFRCIAIDLPGNGFSSRNGTNYSIDFYAGILIEFIIRLQLKNVVLVGHSMGGLIALKVALSKRIPLQKMILCAPAGFEKYTPQESVLFKSAIAMGNFLNLDETQLAQSVRTSFFSQSEITDKIISDLSKIIQQNNRSLYRSMLEQSIYSMLDENIFKDLKHIPCKTLVFFGEEDALIPNKFLHPVSTKEIATKATAQMPQATLIMYENCGHFVHIEKANKVNEAIIRFLK
jgi:pimeloyl-ACP methyl ester carboxylesterase